MVEVDGEPVSTPVSYLHQYLVPILLGGLSLLLVALSITIFIKSYQPTDKIRFEHMSPASASGMPSGKRIFVDIEGEVKRPGLYALPASSRVDDALREAGGLSDQADSGYIARTFNRAAMLEDGAKIFIPSIAEGEKLGSEGSHESVPGTVNINTASKEDLESLDGVGPVTADRIIEGRPYTRTEELVERDIVSRNLLDKMKDRISL